MPDPYAIPAKAIKEQPASKFIVMALHRTLRIDGEERLVEDTKSGLCGFIPVFDTYDQALSAANGAEDRVKQISPTI